MQETEDRLNKNMAAFKRQIDEDAKEKERLAREKARVEEALRALQAKLGELDGSVSHHEFYLFVFGNKYSDYSFWWTIVHST